MGESEQSTSSQVSVAFSAHWVNACFVMLFATPYVSVDDLEYECAWRGERMIEVTAGQRRLETYIKYARSGSRLGIGTVNITLPAGKTVRVVSRNGWANHMPFLPTVIDAPFAGSQRETRSRSFRRVRVASVGVGVLALLPLVAVAAVTNSAPLWILGVLGAAAIGYVGFGRRGEASEAQRKWRSGKS